MKNTLIICFALIFILSFSNAENPEITVTTKVLPADNIWNAPVNTLPVSAKSDTFINTIGKDKPLHPDFGSGLYDGAPIGIPFLVVSGTQPKVSVSFTYDDESDAGPYPVPANAPIEGGSSSDGDRHVIIIDNDNGKLYELYNSFPQTDGSWVADSGAIYDLNSNDLRPDTWTSADAAGLPIFPGLIRYDEVAAGAINHAIRFTTNQTKKEYIWPARHYASSLTDDKYPPLGQRFRLKSTFDSSSYSANMKVIITALKTYGMILADNGSPWFISGAPDDRWDNDVLNELKNIKGSDFEAVDCSSLMVSANSGQVKNFTDTIAPSTPTGLASSSITETTFTLAWISSTDNIGVTGYKVYQNGVQVGTTSVNSLAISNLSAGTSYTFTVSANDAATNNSALSNSLSVTTITTATPDIVAPTIPTNLSSTSITPSSFTLSWTASTDAVGVTGYKIFQDNVQIGTSATTNIAISGLTTATTYSYTVSAYDAAANNSSVSNALSVTTTSTTDSIAPSIPTGLTSTSITQSTFTLSWTASTDAVGVTGYKIYQNGVLIGTSAALNYSVIALSASTTYSYTVSAYDIAGNNSSLSTALSVSTLVAADTTAPSTPTSLISSEITQNSFTLTWTPSIDTVGVTNYHIFKDGIETGSSVSSSFAITGLLAETNYSFTVTANDAAGNISAPSTALSVTTLATIITTDTTTPTDDTGTPVSGNSGISAGSGGSGGGCNYSPSMANTTQAGNIFLIIASLFFLIVFRKNKN